MPSPLFIKAGTNVSAMIFSKFAFLRYQKQVAKCDCFRKELHLAPTLDVIKEGPHTVTRVNSTFGEAGARGHRCAKAEPKKTNLGVQNEAVEFGVKKMLQNSKAYCRVFPLFNRLTSLEPLLSLRHKTCRHHANGPPA